MFEFDEKYQQQENKNLEDQCAEAYNKYLRATEIRNKARDLYMLALAETPKEAKLRKDAYLKTDELCRLRYEYYVKLLEKMCEELYDNCLQTGDVVSKTIDLYKETDTREGKDIYGVQCDKAYKMYKEICEQYNESYEKLQIAYEKLNNHTV